MNIKTLVSILLLLSLYGCAGNPFAQAAYQKSPQLFSKALKKSDPNKPEKTAGWTAIHYAARMFPSKIGETIAVGANVNAKNNDGWSALHIASRYTPAAVLPLIQAGAKINKKTNGSPGYTPLQLAMKFQPEAAIFLVNAGASADERHIEDVDQVTLLMREVSVYGNDTKLVEAILKNKPNLNLKDKKGETALMKAAIRAHLKQVELLVRAGGDVHAKDNKGWTALMHAAVGGVHSGSVVKVLLDTNADINEQAGDGTTTLMIALKNKNIRVWRVLNKNLMNIDLDTQDNKGWTALMFAAYKDVASVTQLLSAGADYRLKNNAGETASGIFKRNTQGWGEFAFVARNKRRVKKIFQGLDEGSSYAALTAIDNAEELQRKEKAKQKRLRIEQQKKEIYTRINSEPSLRQQFERAGKAVESCRVFRILQKRQFGIARCPTAITSQAQKVRNACLNKKNQIFSKSKKDEKSLCREADSQKHALRKNFSTDKNAALFGMGNPITILGVLDDFQVSSGVTKQSVSRQYAYLMNIRGEVRQAAKDFKSDREKKYFEEIRKRREQDQQAPSALSGNSFIARSLKAIGDSLQTPPSNTYKPVPAVTPSVQRTNTTQQNTTKPRASTYRPNPIVKPQASSSQNKTTSKSASNTASGKVTLGAGSWSDVYGTAAKGSSTAAVVKAKVEKKPRAKIKSVEMVVGSVGIGYEKSIALGLAQDKVTNYVYKACGNISRGQVEWGNALCYAKTKNERNVICKQPADVTCYTDSCMSVSETCGYQQSTYTAPRSALTITDRAAYDLLNADHRVLE